MKKNLMLIDVNNIGFAAQSKAVLRVGEQQVQAVFGVLRSLRMLTSRFPDYTPIVLWDGLTWRKTAFTDYKANRDKPPKTKTDKILAEQRRHFRTQRPLIERGLELLGVNQMIAANLEADDLAAKLVRAYPDNRVLLISGDQDWIQLISPRVTWINPIGSKGSTKPTTISPRTIKERLGVENARAWLEVKVIKGDISDNIPGVGGIGEKGAIELVNTYGSVTSFLNQVCVEKTIDYETLPKKFRDLVDIQEKQEIYHRNMMLMDLNDRRVPKPVDLVRTRGKFDPVGFEAYCKELMFKSFLADLPGWMEPFNPNPESALKEAA